MIKSIPLILFLFIQVTYSSQVTINKNLSEKKEERNPKHISFGWSNTIPSILSFTNSNTLKETFQFSFDYEEETDTNTFFRIGLAVNSTSEKISTIRNYYLEPLIVNFGLGKQFFSGREDKILPYIDLFYTQSLKGARFGSGLWQGDEYGAGIVAGIKYIKPLNVLWEISFEVNGGGGFFRDFKNLGTTTQMVMVPKLFSTRPLGISLRYRFQ